MHARDAQEAMDWARECFVSSAYYLDPHAIKRMAQRRIQFTDVGRVLTRPQSATQYHAGPKVNGGDEWRIYGTNDEGEELAAGVEFYDENGRRMAVITVFYTGGE